MAGNGKDSGKLKLNAHENGAEAGSNLPAHLREQRNVLGKRNFGREEVQLLAKSESMALPSKVSLMDGMLRPKAVGPAKNLLGRHGASERVKILRPLSGIDERDLEEASESGDLLVAKAAVDTNSVQDADSCVSSAVDGVRTITKPASIELSSRAKGEKNSTKSLSNSAQGATRDSVPNRGRPAPLSEMAKDSIGSGPAPEIPDSPASVNSEDSDLANREARSAEARNRWRRVKHTLAFAHKMSHNMRTNSSDFLEHSTEDRIAQEPTSTEGAGRAGAAAFEGAKLRGRFRAKGRKGMEGMIVKQDKGMVTLIQDFYVAFLKMPIANFLIGVFLAPIALGLFFTPIYLFDRGGLSFNGVAMVEEVILVSRVAAAKMKVSALVNVFLYALSLSTTFGGSPVDALSPFCLVVANINTLMGQFLFVFLSGAVFARMSQPSRPIRCSRVAIIRPDDFTLDTAEGKEKSKVFAVRLVLTGPAPCELVDAKICLTFRIFIKLPSGSVFCSTQDLDLVRPEVSYLRYGIMVRHVIDSKSPVYGHTLQSLQDGDASFSLTIMGMERASMQPIFHLEDYFVCDGEVAWDADYIDFIHINNQGHRVLDHSKIDLIRVGKESREGGIFQREKEASQVIEEQRSAGILKGWKADGVTKRKVNTKSTSFTRAD